MRTLFIALALFIGGCGTVPKPSVYPSVSKPYFESHRDAELDDYYLFIHAKWTW